MLLYLFAFKCTALILEQPTSQPTGVFVAPTPPEDFSTFSPTMFALTPTDKNVGIVDIEREIQKEDEVANRFNFYVLISLILFVLGFGGYVFARR